MLPEIRPPAMTMLLVHPFAGAPAKNAAPGCAAFSADRQWRLVTVWLFIFSATSGGRFGGSPVRVICATVSHWPGLSFTSGPAAEAVAGPPGDAAAPDDLFVVAAAPPAAPFAPAAALSLLAGVGMPQAASARTSEVAIRSILRMAFPLSVAG